MSNTNGRGGPDSSNRPVDRAFAAGASPCAAVVAMTGIFIARIDELIRGDEHRFDYRH